MYTETLIIKGQDDKIRILELERELLLTYLELAMMLLEDTSKSRLGMDDWFRHRSILENGIENYKRYQQ